MKCIESVIYWFKTHFYLVLSSISFINGSKIKRCQFFLVRTTRRWTLFARCQSVNGETCLKLPTDNESLKSRPHSDKLHVIPYKTARNFFSKDLTLKINKFAKLTATKVKISHEQFTRLLMTLKVIKSSRNLRWEDLLSSTNRMMELWALAKTSLASVTFVKHSAICHLTYQSWWLLNNYCKWIYMNLTTENMALSLYIMG